MIGIPSVAQIARPIVTEDLVGAWSLESYADALEGGGVEHPLGSNPRGLLIYTPDGLMSAQLMSGVRPPPTDATEGNAEIEGEYQGKASGFIGYCGEYHFDEVAAIVYHPPSV
jgi:hypothetical protein